MGSSNTAEFEAIFSEDEFKEDEFETVFSEDESLITDFKQAHIIQTGNYNDLSNKPQINGVVIEGEKNGEAYKLQDKLVAGDGVSIVDNGDHTATISFDGGGGTSDYNELTNKPSIEEHVLSGNSTLKQIGVDIATVAEIEAILYIN